MPQKFRQGKASLTDGLPAVPEFGIYKDLSAVSKGYIYTLYGLFNEQIENYDAALKIYEDKRMHQEITIVNNSVDKVMKAWRGW